MAATVETLGIDKLSTEEQLGLVHAIWNHIATNQSKPMLHDAQREDLRRRIDDDDARPDDLVPWEQVKVEARKRLEK
jgi:putative addiction module component (TIGR02574 family)